MSIDEIHLAKNSTVTFHVEHERTFLWGPYTAKASIESDLVPETQPLVEVFCKIIKILEPVVPQYILCSKTIDNLRGRPIEAFEKNELVKLPPGEEELLYISGYLEQHPKSSEDTITNDKPETLPFALKLNTRFLDFPSRASIRHELLLNYSGPQADTLLHLQLSSLAKFLPLRFSHIRLGLELFEPKFVGQWFGFSPDIVQRFYLEADEHRIMISTQEDRLSSAKALPFGKLKAIEQIIQLIQR